MLGIGALEARVPGMNGCRKRPETAKGTGRVGPERGSVTPIHSHGAVICSNPLAVVGPMTCCRMMPCRSIIKVSGWPVTPKA